MCATAARWSSPTRRFSPSLTKAQTGAKSRPRWFSPPCCAPCCAIPTAAQGSCLSLLTKLALSAWTRCSESSASMRRWGSSTNRWITTSCSRTPKAKTGSCLKKASPKRAAWPNGSPPAPATPTSACRCCRCMRSIPCSASSEWATPSGRRPTREPEAFCSGPLPGAPPSQAKASSIKTATATFSPALCQPAKPTTPPLPTSSRP